MAELSCGGSLMKYILFFFNIVFFISGAAILGIGIWLKVDPDAKNILQIVDLNNGGKLMDVAIYVLIGIGAFIFLVGFLGCCGACRESSCMLCLYAGLLVIVFIGEIVVAVMAIVFRGRISTELKNNMQKQVAEKLQADPKTSLAIVWNGVQYGLKCCGAVNASDYDMNANFSGNIPQTCCKMGSLKADNPAADDYAACQAEFASWKSANPSGTYPNFYTQGCYDSLSEWIKKHAGILIGIGFGIAIVQLFGIIFACCVRGEINKGAYA